MKKSAKRQHKERARPAEYIQEPEEFYDDEEDGRADETREMHKSLNRIAGQVEGIRGMLLDGRKPQAVLHQCKAVHAALRSLESKLLAQHLERVIEDLARTGKRRLREEKMESLLDLYKKVA